MPKLWKFVIKRTTDSSSILPRWSVAAIVFVGSGRLQVPYTFRWVMSSTAAALRFQPVVAETMAKS